MDSRFKTMADCAPVLLWMSGTDSECQFFNQTWLDFTGRPMEMELGVGWAEGIHPEDFQHCMDQYLSAFVARKAFRMEYRLRRHDGRYRWVLDTGVPRYDTDGSFAGYIGSCVDVTEIKEARESLERNRNELELAVRDRTAELARSNADLEQFALLASHDLREPLRKMAGYAQLLSGSCGDRLGAEESEWIGAIIRSADRMGGMIEALLAYARVGRRSPPADIVHLDDVLTEALDDLDPMVRESGAQMHREPLPTVRGDRNLLRQLFANLLSNSLKFRGARSPDVRIGAEQRRGEWVVYVEDNGIGLPDDAAPQVFHLFKRFHPRSSFPGMGLGLSMCKRIVEHHGGRIWVTSGVDRGSSFQFTLSGAAAPVALLRRDGSAC